MQINKNLKDPLYIQLMEVITNYINNNNLKPDSLIPSERELSQKYNVSRATVRRALNELIYDGVLYKIPGKGTFVSHEKFKQDLLEFYSFSEEMKKISKVPSSEIISFNVIKANNKIAKKMECSVGEPIYKLERLRYADDEPMMFEINHLLVSRFPDLSLDRLTSYSMYDILIKDYNADFTEAEETLQPVSTRENEAYLLDYNVGLPSMMIERCTYERGKVVEYTKSISRGDKFKYHISLKK